MPRGIGYSPYKLARIKKKYKRRYVRRRRFKRSMRKKYYKKIYARRRKFRKVKRHMVKKTMRHGKAIRNLQKKVKTAVTEFVSRTQSYGVFPIPENSTAWLQESNIDNRFIEDAIVRLPFFDPTNPATLIETNMAGVPRSQWITLKKCTVTVELMPNYNMPAHIEVYVCSVKTDTGASPITMITQDAPNLGTAVGPISNNPIAFNNPLLYPNDCPTLLEGYKVKKIASYWHQPGWPKTFSVTSYNIDHNFHSADVQFELYRRKLKTKFLLFRCHGPIAHDANQTNFAALGNSKLDFKVTKSLHFQYSGTMEAKRYEFDNTDAVPFPQGAQINQKPGAAVEILNPV